MKLINTKIAFLFYCLFLLLLSCNTSKNIGQSAMINQPASFDGNRDTTNVASQSWRFFFTDKYLADLIDTVITNNWDVQVAVQRMQFALADVRLAKGSLKPEAGVATSAGVRKFGRYTMDGAGNISTEMKPGKIVPEHLPDYFIGLQTSWEIDVWGKLRNKKKAAAMRYLSTAEGKNIVLTNLVAEVALAYYHILSLDQSLKIIGETIKVQSDALEIVKVQKEAAVVTELAVQQFEARLLNLQDMNIGIKQEIALLENHINFLAARYPGPLQRDTFFLKQKLHEKIAAGIPSQLLENRPDIRQALFDLKASKADLLAAKADFYPSLTIGGNIGYQAFQTGLLFTTPESFTYWLIGNLAMPLINRSAIKSQFAKADARQREALYNYQKVILTGFKEVYDEMISIKHLGERYEVKQRETSVLKNAVEISDELYLAGRATYLEVLLTQQNTLQAQLELVDMKKEQLRSAVKIYKALGGGWL